MVVLDVVCVMSSVVVAASSPSLVDLVVTVTSRSLKFPSSALLAITAPSWFLACASGFVVATVGDSGVSCVVLAFAAST